MAATGPTARPGGLSETLGQAMWPCPLHTLFITVNEPAGVRSTCWLVITVPRRRRRPLILSTVPDPDTFDHRTPNLGSASAGDLPQEPARPPPSSAKAQARAFLAALRTLQAME